MSKLLDIFFFYAIINTRKGEPSKSIWRIKHDRDQFTNIISKGYRPFPI